MLEISLKEFFLECIKSKRNFCFYMESGGMGYDLDWNISGIDKELFSEAYENLKKALDEFTFETISSSGCEYERSDYDT